MKPRIIWLDDDINKASLLPTVALFKRRFEIIECENIDVFYNKSVALEWDAAIIDVVNEKAENADVFPALQYIATKFHDKLWFVFSGQEQITKKENDVKKALSGKAYERSYVSKTIYVKDEDEESLIKDISTAVSNKRKWQIESEYERVLSIAERRLADKNCRKDLLDILCAAAGIERLDSHLYYTRIRIILEWMFRAARNVGLLHDRCFDRQDHINLTDASLFMAGKPTLHSGVMCKVSHFPHLIARNVRSILEITGGASHTTEVDTKDNPNLLAYWSTIDTPYLLFSLTYMLCDVLIWFDSYVSEHSDISTNKANWKTLIMAGRMNMDREDRYYVGDCYIPNWKAKYSKVGDNIEVTDVEETDPKLELPYPLTAKYIKSVR